MPSGSNAKSDSVVQLVPFQPPKQSDGKGLDEDTFVAPPNFPVEAARDDETCARCGLSSRKDKEGASNLRVQGYKSDMNCPEKVSGTERPSIMAPETSVDARLCSTCSTIELKPKTIALPQPVDSGLTLTLWQVRRVPLLATYIHVTLSNLTHRPTRTSLTPENEEHLSDGVQGLSAS
ncbi:hypothetical protein BS50DRAFT_583893 [Corynespora cassiicola Philippines]|uniref:Uncharacterized protein n=1 Tax=Corynespora cassiicola Philippines TaxID=1448308 RepID=A0A2T2P3X3_CORCC|nr:hypothetical protein BS50DRAFT_583893 [Corynespora cassiicola Philippines]